MLSMQPLVSILIPSYNHEKYIAKTIESCLAQTYNNIEVIVVDDASSDNTFNIAKKYEAIDQRIRVYKNSSNCGPSATTIECFNRSVGDYVSPMPSDDVALPEKIELQIREIVRDNKIGLVYTAVNYIDDDGILLKKNQSFASNAFDFKRRIRREWLHYFFNNGNCICGSGPLLPRAIYEKYCINPALIQLQDFDIWVKIAIDGYEIVSIDIPLVNYRIQNNGGNLSAPNFDSAARTSFEYRKILENFKRISDCSDMAFLIEDRDFIIDQQFPSSVQWHIALAKYALTKKSFAHKVFGMDLIYEVVSTTEVSVLNKIGFSIKQYKAITSKDTIYNLYRSTPSGFVITLLSNHMPRHIFQLYKLVIKAIGINK